MKRIAPATSRNRDPILAVLRDALPASARVLEVASGSGEHAIWFARHLPQVTWQPSDPSDDALASIAAWRDEASLPNLLPPIRLDVHDAWDLDPFDAIVCINMVHIAPWTAAEALFAHAARLAPLLFLYGPYRFDGVTAASNEGFDASLRAQDPRWGVRDVRDLDALGAKGRLVRRGTVAMPANNHCLIYSREAP